MDSRNTSPDTMSNMPGDHAERLAKALEAIIDFDNSEALYGQFESMINEAGEMSNKADEDFRSGDAIFWEGIARCLQRFQAVVTFASAYRASKAAGWRTDEPVGYVTFVGWRKPDDPGEEGERFQAIIDYPNGPPAFPVKYVWNKVPVYIMSAPPLPPPPLRESET